MEKNRKADIILLVMLLASFILSLDLSMVILDYVEKYPESILKVPLNFFGSLKHAGGPFVYVGDKINIEQGLFFLPFSIFSIISFIVYCKVLKGKITDTYDKKARLVKYRCCPYCKGDLSSYSDRTSAFSTTSVECPFCGKKIYGGANIAGEVAWYTFNPNKLIGIAIIGFIILMAVVFGIYVIYFLE